ncbi:MAG: molybdenum cofactor biosynthesis protein MoaE [Deltaproteobacteria bacterium]|nr:molybdenum cofactor biosynthesis protein MoaE [Deltaproteobacteria bacterium]
MGEVSREADIEVAVATEPFLVAEIYSQFIKKEGDATGTVVMHHGRVKYPGKVLPDFRVVSLDALVSDVCEGLRTIGVDAAWNFTLHRIFILHRLGIVERGGDVLLVICSAATRREAFDACSWIVDEVKKEQLISLRELPF